MIEENKGKILRLRLIAQCFNFDIRDSKFSLCFYRLQNSENLCKTTDESQSELKAEMKGKVNALQNRLADLDTLR